MPRHLSTAFAAFSIIDRHPAPPSPELEMPDPLKLPIIIQRDATLVPRVIRILHPGYYPPENTLLHLHAVNDGGIDFDTVMAMCSILTGNTTIGFLSGAAVGSNDSAVVKDLLEPHVEVRVDDVHDEGDAAFLRGVALGDEGEDFFREDGG